MINEKGDKKMQRKINKTRVLIVFIIILIPVMILLNIKSNSTENISKENIINSNISNEESNTNTTKQNVIIVDITDKEENNETIEQSTGEPEEQPKEEPVEEPTEEPVEDPAENPTEQQPAEEPVEEPIEQPTDESEENTTNESNNKGNREFGSTVAFIGDSRTQAFLMYTGLKNVTDYTNIGLMVDTAVTKKFVTNSQGEKITILEDLKTKDIDTVYIMLGINELGWVYSSIFIQKYENLIDKIKEIKPDCEVIVQSIIPVTKTKSDNDDIYNNERITEYNTLIKQMAERKQIQYIDLVPILADSSGNLPEDASPDGVHLNKEYCLKWLECLKNN